MSKKIADTVVNALENLKARDICVLDVRKMTSITDTMIIAIGTSDRQVRALAEEVIEKCKETGERPIGVEGLEGGEWVLVDLADVLVHVMLPKIRDFYNLEKLWAGSADAGAVAPGGSVDLDVVFDATNVCGVNLLADVLIASNDPDEPEVHVPARLIVSGDPDIAVDPVSLDFGSVPVWGSAEDVVTVRNEACGVLSVSALDFDHPDFSTLTLPFELGPGEVRDVTVVFSPSAAGPITGTLAIVSNDPDEGTTTVDLAGEGFEPDVLEVPGVYPTIQAAIDDVDALELHQTVGDVLGYRIADPVEATDQQVTRSAKVFFRDHLSLPAVGFSSGGGATSTAWGPRVRMSRSPWCTRR